MIRMWVAAGAALGLVVAPVQASCWTHDEAAAAGIRQLQSMLMVTALRCQAGGEGMMADYNKFVTANRGAIAAENDRIRGHFIHTSGAVLGQRAYDSFTTSMANGYGAGEGAPESCGAAADLAREASTMAGSHDGLMMFVTRLGLEAHLPEGRCETRAAVALASAASVAASALPAVPRSLGSTDQAVSAGPGASGRPVLVPVAAMASASTALAVEAVADVDPR